MFILDSDHTSLLEWGGEGSVILRERLADLSRDEVVTTIVSYEEHMRGWMAYLACAKSLEQQVEAYQRLRRHLDNYRQIKVIDFDAAASRQFAQLRRSHRRLGTMDLKISAIAIATGATLLTRYLTDFQQVPGLSVEDWTKPSDDA